MMGEIISENAYALILCIVKDIEREVALDILGIKRVADKNFKGIPEAEKENIEKYYHEDNLSTMKIGEMYGVSDTKLRKYMREHEIEIKSRGNKCPISSDEKATIEKYYHEDEKTMKEIAKIYNVSVMAISDYMRREGIKSRSRGRSKLI